jgi:sugar phosphate permease
MGIAYLGIGIGGAIVPLLAAWLTSHFGWRVSLQIVGALVVAIAFPLAFFVPEQRGQHAHGELVGPATRPLTLRQAQGSGAIGGLLTSPAFYLLAIGSMCSIAAVGGTNQHLKLFLSLDRGYSQGDAASIISLVLAVSIAGRLLMGWLADRIPVKYVMLLIYLLVAVSVPLLLASGSRSTIVAFAIVFGLGLGGEYMIIPLMAGQLFGVAVLGRVMGIVLTADGVAEATAPMLVGYLRDHSGSYTTGFITLVATAIAGAIAIALLPQRTPSLCVSSTAKSSSAVREEISSR